MYRRVRVFAMVANLSIGTPGRRGAPLVLSTESCNRTCGSASGGTSAVDAKGGLSLSCANADIYCQHVECL